MSRCAPLLALLLLAASAEGADPPFYPSALNTSTGLPVSLSDFTPARECAYCHPFQHEQWQGSMHGQAFADPLFQAVWKEASRETGGKMDRFCAGCHTPTGTASEQVWIRETGEIVIDPLAEDGVTCDFCHSVERVILLERGGNPGNAGLSVDPDGPKRGPYLDAFSTFHETAYSDVHTRSEFCGACHNVFHPFSGTAIARTYEEWKGTIYAENEIHCQDCHMVPPDEAARVAATLEKPVLSGQTSNLGTERTPFFHHDFTGANAAMPTLLGYPDRAGEARARLQSAARLEVAGTGAPSPGREMEIAVRVQNVGAGHNLPTSMNEIRQMWLHVEARDGGEQGRLLWESGALADDGSLVPGTRTFGAQAVDDQGRPTWKPWQVSRIVSDNSIPARAQVLETYRVPLPADLRGPVRVAATLRYRSFPQQVADQYLGKSGYVVPVVDMASHQTTVEVGRP